MTDGPPPPTIRPYRAFPAFDDWMSSTAVSPLVDRFFAKFAAMRERQTDDRLIERATRWAAIDTGAIENLYDVDRGFTISVAASAALLQTIADEKGAAVERAVADAIAAYDFVLDLATRRAVVTEVAIRELHSIVCRSQTTYRVVTAVGPQDQPLPKGVYKSHENRPLNLASNEIHSYAPVADTPAEMARLIEQLRTPEFTSAHPVQQAAYAHYAFVAVHPFADGNGRVSRALASVFLYRSPGLPLVVFSDEKPEYLRALESADDGRYQFLVTFVADRVIDAVNLLDSQQGPPLPSIPAQAAAFARELDGRGGYPHTDVDAGAVRLMEALERALTEVVAGSGITAPLDAVVTRRFEPVPSSQDGFRTANTGMTLVLQLQSAAPAQAQAQVAFAVEIAKGLEGDVDYVVSSTAGSTLEVFLREVLPVVTRSLELRLKGYAERLLQQGLVGLTEAARRALRTNGYL